MHASILLKEKTDFTELQLLRNHIKSEIFVIYMTFGYSVLYFLNLSLKHFPPKKTAIYVKISKSEVVVVPCLNAFAHAQSTYFPIEDRRHCTLLVQFNDICPSYSGAKLLKLRKTATLLLRINNEY